MVSPLRFSRESSVVRLFYSSQSFLNLACFDSCRYYLKNNLVSGSLLPDEASQVSGFSLFISFSLSDCQIVWDEYDFGTERDGFNQYLLAWHENPEC